MVSPRLILNFRPLIPKSVFVHPSAVVVGNVRLGENVSIWPNAVLRGDCELIQMYVSVPFGRKQFHCRGNRSNVQDGAVIHARGVFGNSTSGVEGNPTIIGDDVSLGHKACVHGCTIEDKCLIGINSVILDGVYVESYTLVAAGAVVTPGKVLNGGLWAGTPAKRIRDLTDHERGMLTDNALNYVELKDVWKEAFLRKLI